MIIIENNFLVERRYKKTIHPRCCYRTECGFAHLPHSKANLLTLGCGKGNYSIYLQDAKQGEGAARAQKMGSPRWLSGKGF